MLITQEFGYNSVLREFQEYLENLTVWMCKATDNHKPTFGHLFLYKGFNIIISNFRICICLKLA